LWEVVVSKLMKWWACPIYENILSSHWIFYGFALWSYSFSLVLTGHHMYLQISKIWA
jgi:hypothetical protein